MNTMMVRHIFSVSTGSTPSSGDEGYWDGPVQWATPEDLGALDQPYLHETRRTLTEDGYAASGAVIVPSGSLVLTKRAPIGRVAILATDACANQGCLLLNPKQGIDSRYYYYWLRCQSEHLNSLGRGSTFMELSTDDLKSLRAPYPSPATQRAIADFLDAETARIDALIAAKENLLTILAEKRRALITQAVTRGLDPSAPMRDSGIPWLGEIPAHWKVTRVGLLASVQNGSTPSRNMPEYWDPDGIPWVSSGQVNDYDVTQAEEYISEEGMRASNLRIVPAGSVLVGMVGQGRTRGMSARLLIDACINQNVAAVTPRDSRMSGGFLHLVFEHAYDPLRNYGRGGNQAALNCELIGEFQVPLPPRAEQDKIVDTVRTKMDRLEALESSVAASLPVIRERREAVIAAAVTGQLDVEQV